MNDIGMKGRIALEATIILKTGLHIGAGEKGIKIGGTDKSVVRNPLDERPYIPGSSLKGKMRSLLEKAGNKPLVQLGPVRMHQCKTEEVEKVCELCRIFGLPSEIKAATPTRLVIRDAFLTNKSAEELKKAKEEGKTDFLYTEIKSENAIDRITSAANPREFERVPAGAEFGFEAIYTIYENADIENFKIVLEGMRLLEDDYLGGHGSRGYGKVEFKDLKLFWSTTKDYEEGRPRTNLIAKAGSLGELRLEDVVKKLREA
ncbi:MAG: type III-A CRISPR-associated RAMP protein Csm3 [Thermoplasmata archaeon]